ncbi:MAG: hypothetical protein WC485_09940 [Opitutaceae bacterium]
MFALLLLGATLAGFQQFYLHGRAYPGREILPHAQLLIVAHGVAMSGWIVLFLVQPMLIISANRRLHMTLGKIGAVLAAAIVVLGLQVPIAVTRFGPEFPLWGLTRRQFMAIPIISILIFGVFVAIGVWYRRRPEIHRPMMLLATLSIMAAATDRITGLPALYAASFWGRVFGPFFPALLIGALFPVVHWLLTRAFDRWYAAGYAALVVANAMIMALAPSEAWGRFAAFLVG